jgi:hypothetical protein
MRDITISSFLCILITTQAFAQNSGNVTAGSCSPITPNNRGSITIQCSGMSDELANQLVDILNQR